MFQKAPLHLPKEDNALNDSNGDKKDSASDISDMIKQVSEPLKSTSEDTLKALPEKDTDTPVVTDSALPDQHILVRASSLHASLRAITYHSTLLHLEYSFSHDHMFHHQANVTVRDPVSERSVVRFSQQPQDNVSSEEFQPDRPRGTRRQERDHVKMPKGQHTPVPQRRAPGTRKQPSRKALHKEEKRRRKAAMDSPQQPSDKQEMVLSALREIWDVCELGRGPKDLAQLKAPCPSEHYLMIHGQHLKTIRKYDYLQVRHLWKTLCCVQDSTTH